MVEMVFLCALRCSIVRTKEAAGVSITGRPIVPCAYFVAVSCAMIFA